jgi:hypothetical protein
MKTARSSDRYIIGRENNVVRVDFDRRPDPPNPQFPGAGALRSTGAYQIDHLPWSWNGVQATSVGRYPARSGANRISSN